MTFLHPEFIYFMLPAVIILFALLLTQREHIADYFEPEVIDKLRVHSRRLSLRTRNLLFFLISVLLILALAQPVFSGGKIKVQAKSADLVVALDISDSMLAQDLYPTRLEHAKLKILELLDRAPKERIGVMAFAKASYLVSPLSFDFRAVRYLVEQLRPGYITEKGTNLTQLLESVGEMMASRERKYLLIFTDGGDQETFSEAITLAKSLGITVFVMGVGTEKGAPVKTKEGQFVKHNGAIITSRLNSAIAELATETGGSYIESVLGSEDIEAMLGEIRSKTTQRVMAEEEITRYEQLFYLPLGLAMLLLLIATSSMSARKRVEMPLGVAVLLLLASHGPSHAGLLDFMTLNKAKQAYEAGDFAQSAEGFGEVAPESPYATYDQANALYRDKQYAEAAALYASTAFEGERAEFNRLHNLGNAYAKQGSPEALKKAVEAYEKALQIREEAPTRANLEAVKRFLDQQKSEKQPNQNDQDKKGKQQESKEGDPQDKSGKQRAQQPQNEQNQQSKGGEERSQKHDKRQQQSGEQSQGGSQDKPRPDEQQQPEQVKSAKEEQPDKKKPQDEKGASAGEPVEEGMSDLEAEKWMEMLNERPAGHIYQIGPKPSPQERDDEKPW
jgi:Ca-activated chloride channel family protein